MRVLVIEDNPKMAAAVCKGLREHGFAADEAHTGCDGEELAASGVYDVVVLDLMLPDRDGVEVCRNLRRRGAAVKVLMLTALSATQDKIAGLDAGADDYLVKPFEFEELLRGVRPAAPRRRVRVAPPAVRRAGTGPAHAAPPALRQTIELSNKEFGLLEYLMRNPNRVLSRTQIGEKVWDMSFEPTSNVVDVYVSALRKKIDRGFERPLIHTVKGVGYRFGVLDDA